MTVDDPIRSYCDAVAANAELARADLVEIEDHLRELAVELEQGGMSATGALAEACRRLGAPAALAREYSRVRPRFGVRPSRARAWSAVALLAWWWLDFARMTLDGPNAAGIGSIYGVNLVISTVAMCGLAARASWARAIILGALSWFVVEVAITLAARGDFGWGVRNVWGSVCMLGAFAFVMPWRRRELTAAGLAIVLLAWTYHGVNTLAMYQMTAPSQMPFASTGLSIAFVATLAAGLGVLARVRWAAVAAFAAGFGLALGLALCYTDILALVSWQENAALLYGRAVGAIAAGACAAVAAAIVSWRCARWTQRAARTTS